ncbi:MAG: hypothetical protein EBR09_09495 [Proteobacteria bacterium]|nr:hypothetical protein [Pseudomonadota bacterium]
MKQFLFFILVVHSAFFSAACARASKGPQVDDRQTPQPAQQQPQKSQDSALAGILNGETNEIYISQQSSVPACNGFELTYRREPKELLLGRCPKTSESAVPSHSREWSDKSTFKLSNEQVKRTEEIISAIKIIKQDSDGSACGVTGGSPLQILSKFRNGDSQAYIGGDYFCIMDKTLIPLSKESLDTATDQLNKFLMELSAGMPASGSSQSL